MIGLRVSPFLLLISWLMLGCMSTTVVFDEKWQSSSKPTYTDYYDQYFIGFSGVSVVHLEKVCMDQKIHAAQKIKTSEDMILTGLTLGIYSPVTVNVWCGD